MLLKVTQPTVFKLTPTQSDQLPIIAKVPIADGWQAPLLCYKEEQGHFHITLGKNNGQQVFLSAGDGMPRNTWYVYKGHVEIDEPATAEFWLNVPYFSQRDNYRDWWRTCNSSSCAMGLAYLKPNSIKNDDEYLKKVFALGDTTDHAIQTQVLEGYGAQSQFAYNLGYSDLDRALAAKKPVVIGILHRGTIANPAGGHMIVVIGKYQNGYICHDPWGDLNTAYASTNGKSVRYSYKTLNARWLADGDNSGWGRIFN
jgi:hypothetical protein